jgi:hypothetical protein
MRIFVSHAAPNRTDAELVAHALTAHNEHEVFLDKKVLQPGQPYFREIRQQIDASDLFVCLLSRDALKPRSYVLFEIDYASKRKPALPPLPVDVGLEREDYQQIPAYLRGVSILQPSGNVAAHVEAEVARLPRLAKLSSQEQRTLLEDHSSRLQRRLSGAEVASNIVTVALVACLVLFGFTIANNPGLPTPQLAIVATLFAMTAVALVLLAVRVRGEVSVRRDRLNVAEWALGRLDAAGATDTEIAERMSKLFALTDRRFLQV